MMKLRRCPARSAAGAEKLVEDIFKKYPQAADLSISSIAKECQRLNPGLGQQEVYDAIVAVGPSDQEVEEHDRKNR